MKNTLYWFKSLYKVWKQEYRLISHDAGVLLFFLLLPTIYPLVYTLIYNPEVVTELPVAIVDDNRSEQSRQLARMADATEAIHIIGYANDMQEARHWLNEKACYGILYIPNDFSRNIARGNQATAQFYCDMSLLIRYRTFLSALTDISLAYGTEIRQEIIPNSTMPIDSKAVIMGDSTQGFASFVIPGILIIIIQQSLILGITMLGGGANERRRRNNNIYPLQIDAPITASILGKALCYFSIYLPLIIYMLLFVPAMFNLPRSNNTIDWFILIVPFIFASIFLGLTLQRFITERETPFIIVVFSSIVFLFLSGLTWPRYAMSEPWLTISNLIPSTWGVEAFVRINSNGATLQQNATPFIMLWILCIIYFLTAIILGRKKDLVQNNS